ncbi:SAM-dependent methyltransferase, partial [Mycobacterium sp. ITM-2017-0098]
MIDVSGTHTAAIDPTRWPAVSRVPRGFADGAAGAVADRLFRRAAARLPIRVIYPDGTRIGAADPTLPTMVVHRPDAMVRRVGRY